MDTFVQFSRHLADVSGEIIRQYFRADLTVERKTDNSPVTIADKKAEEIMRERIMKEFPEHGILGEEFAPHNPGAAYQWVLDPIDGTKSFISGIPLFGTLIALLENGQPILGVINLPISGEFLVGANGKSHLNDQPVRVRDCATIEDATLLVTSHWDVSEFQDGAAFDTLTKRSRIYRTWGDCYGYYLVATGFADIMLDPIMNYWDLIALVPIIEGAGGRITDWQGNDPARGDSIVATAGPLHDEVIRTLNPTS